VTPYVGQCGNFRLKWFDADSNPVLYKSVIQWHNFRQRDWLSMPGNNIASDRRLRAPFFWIRENSKLLVQCEKSEFESPIVN
jgi:hypothetical protein